MDTTVQTGPPEREPDHVTPVADMTAAEAAQLRALFAGNPVIDHAEAALRAFGVRDGELADAVTLLLAWPDFTLLTEREVRGVAARFVPEPAKPEPGNVTPVPAPVDWSQYGPCDVASCSAATGNPCQVLGYSGDALLLSLPHATRAAREPDGLTPEQIEMDRQASALDDADDWFVIGQTPTTQAEPEPGWTTTPAGYQVPADLDDDPRLWTGEPLDGLTPEQIALDREIEGLDDADDVFVIGQHGAGWPGTDLAPGEPDSYKPAPPLPAYAAEGRCPCGGEPGYACRDAEGVDLVEPHAERIPVVHLDGPGTWESENLPCGRPFNAVRYGETTADAAKVTCAGCRATFAEPEPPRCGHAQDDDCECNGNDQPTAAVTEAFEAARCCAPGPYCDDLPGCVVKAEHTEPAVEPQPERRTVSLEVLTSQLVDEEDHRRRVEAREQGVSVELLPADAKVGVVLRVNGLLAAIVTTDADWSMRRDAVELLEALLQDMRGYAVDGDAELLMPTPDVLAALDGHPNAQLLTAPVPVTCRWIEPGWVVVGYSGPGVEERVEAKSGDCGEPDCPWPGDCTLLTIGDGKPAHFADWSTLTVRIPCAATRSEG